MSIGVGYLVLLVLIALGSLGTVVYLHATLTESEANR